MEVDRSKLSTGSGHDDAPALLCSGNYEFDSTLVGL